MLLLTPHSLHPAFEDGTDTGFRNVGQLQFDAGEIPKRTYRIYIYIYICMYVFRNNVTRDRPQITAASSPTTIKRERTVAFSWKKWLREPTTN